MYARKINDVERTAEVRSSHSININFHQKSYGGF